MKAPKTKKAYCKNCKKHTDHKVSQIKTGTKRGSLKKGSLQRLGKRGSGRSGMGNHGKFSRPSNLGKRHGAKNSKKATFKLTCMQCNKITMQVLRRAKKVELI